VSKTKTADRVCGSIGGCRLYLYVRLPNLIRFISFIYIPRNFGGFPYSVFIGGYPYML